MIDSLPERIALAQLPTPLQPLRRLQGARGGPLIWLKRDDLTGCVLSGNKVRKLEFLVAKAIADGCDTLVTCGGVQSNHCRATALVAAQLGLGCRLLLRGDMGGAADGNCLLDQLCGADVQCIPASEYARNFDTLLNDALQSLQEKGKRPFFIPTGGSDAVGIWGYINACTELSDDFARHAVEPAAIVTASGSGGTQAGLIVGCLRESLSMPVVGINVCDDETYFQKKIGQDIEAWYAQYPSASAALARPFRPSDIQIIDGYVGAGYGLADDDVLEAITQAASLEGVVFDPVYSGKAFAGLCAEIDSGRFADAKDIVFVHTGGVFGLFSFREQFSARRLHSS